MKRVERWAKDDVDTPDLWAELQHQRELFVNPPYEDVEDTLLTADEQAEIAEHLQQIKELVRETYALSEAKILGLDAELDYIREASEQVSRKDLRLLVFRVSRPNRRQ